jgi:hypothetical protein
MDGGVSITLLDAEVKDVSVFLSRNTVRSSSSIVFFDVATPFRVEENAPARIKIQAANSILDSSESLVYFNRVLYAGPQSLSKYQKLAGTLFQWEGDDNVFPLACTCAGFYRDESNRLRKTQRPWTEWKQRWGGKDRNVREGKVRYQGGDLLTRAKGVPLNLNAEEFRLADGSPGKGAGPDGKDLGADVDLVGPGAAYERWKKTPAYQQWQKTVREFIREK